MLFLSDEVATLWRKYSKKSAFRLWWSRKPYSSLISDCTRTSREFLDEYDDVKVEAVDFATLDTPTKLLWSHNSSILFQR